MLTPSWVQSLAQRQPVTPPLEPQPGPACAILPGALLGWPSSAAGRGSPEHSSLGPGRGPSNHGVSDPAAPCGAGWLVSSATSSCLLSGLFRRRGCRRSQSPKFPQEGGRLARGGASVSRQHLANHGPGPRLLSTHICQPQPLICEGAVKAHFTTISHISGEGGTVGASPPLCFHAPAGPRPGFHPTPRRAAAPDRDLEASGVNGLSCRET